jgi:hypothetical protein
VAAQIERKWIDREPREMHEPGKLIFLSRIWHISQLKKRGAKTLEKSFRR